MRKTSPNVPLEERTGILSAFMLKMARSGFNCEQREEVLLAGCKGYWAIRWRERTQGRRINLPLGEGAEERAAGKLLQPLQLIQMPGELGACPAAGGG